MVGSNDGTVEGAAELLRRAEVAGAVGDVTARRAQLVEAFRVARASGDTASMVRAALALPTSQGFGREPGQIPALLHEAYLAADDPLLRARLGAALARAWVYGGDAERAVPFALEAERVAVGSNDSVVLADVLEALLASSWGPDQLDDRVRLSGRLVNAVAHLSDPELVMHAHLWRLTTAWECLDLVAVQRQLRALDVFADESGSDRAAFYATSRRAMYLLAVSDLDAAQRLMTEVNEIGARIAEPDLEGVQRALAADLARQTRDVSSLREQAESFEGFGKAEGIQSIQAEGAVFWLGAGEPERARELALQAAGDDLGAVARDVDFLLTVTSLTAVAASCGLSDMAQQGASLLEPYAGRAVINAGSVTFHGVVDDYLFQASRARTSRDLDKWRDRALSSYRRIGATWWAGQLGGYVVPTSLERSDSLRRLCFYRRADGFWTIGADGSTSSMPDLRGMQYLRLLLSRPGIEVFAHELSDAASGHAGVGVIQRDFDQVLDANAKRAYRMRMQQLDEDIEEARSWADPVRLERMEAERDALVAELVAAAGLGGRMRPVGSTAERSRVAVRKSIATALTRIEALDASLARLLRDTIRTGVTCRYEPDPARPSAWTLQAPETA